jgi:putative ABC transport system ATP-binding protein
VADFSECVREGELVALTGPSGSGKTSLLNALAGFLRPSAGVITFRGQDVAAMTPSEAAAYRNQAIGMVHQFFNLLPDLDSLDNVSLPLLIRGVSKDLARESAQAMLDDLGVQARSRHRPSQLSGGQQQRVAIARALVTQPDVILADEPTGNLDKAATADFLALLRDLHSNGNLTIVLVTHDEAVAEIATRRIDLSNHHGI